MSGHLLAGRLAVVLCGVLLAASVLFAAEWSSVVPWRGASPAHTTAAVVRAAGPLFQDDFTDDQVGAMPTGWTAADGRWDGVVVDSGHVVRHGVGQSYGHLVAGSDAWTDYGVNARLRPSPLSTGFAGVAARYQDRGDYYACGVYYATAVRLWRVLDGVTTLLDARRMDVATDRFHDVRLVVAYDRVSCVFDQTVVLTATDGSFASGRIAFVASSDEAAEFRDVVVSR
jgi:pectate lyase